MIITGATMTNNPKVDHCVEVLCQHGCRAVRGYLASLQVGQERQEFIDLNPQERALLQQELEAIMVVYDRANSSCPL